MSNDKLHTCNPSMEKFISIVTFSVISDSQKLSRSPSVAYSIGCAVSSKRYTVSPSVELSVFFKHFAGSPSIILGWVGGHRQWLATYAGGRIPVNASLASLKRKQFQVMSLPSCCSQQHFTFTTTNATILHICWNYPWHLDCSVYKQRESE